MRCVFLTLLMGILFNAHGQMIEPGILVGTSWFRGDVSPKAEFHHKAFSSFIRFNVTPQVACRLSYAYAEISGDDANALDPSRVSRNLSFRSEIQELAVLGEFNIWNSNRGIAPYVFGGVSAFQFDPTTIYQGEVIRLQPLGTEGQGMNGFEANYNLTQLAVPCGLGFKMKITDQLNLGLEYGLRLTFSDYLDDVSGDYVNYNELLAGNGVLAATLANRGHELDNSEPQQVETGTSRGMNGTNNDRYLIAGATLSYQFANYQKKTKPFKNRNRTGRCPNNF